MRREVREADRERYELATQLGELPTQQEMERRRPALRRAATHAYRYTPLSLDNPLPPGEHIPGDWGADPSDAAAQQSEKDRIRSALHRLSVRQRHVLALHYFGGKSLHQIGETLAISPQRASQLHLAGIRNLRKALHGSH